MVSLRGHFQSFLARVGFPPLLRPLQKDQWSLQLEHPRALEKREPSCTAGGMQTDIATIEISKETPLKTRHKSTI